MLSDVNLTGNIKNMSLLNHIHPLPVKYKNYTFL